MGPFAHALLAWLVAVTFVNTARDRRLVVLAGILADIDGVFILFDRELYNSYHHMLGHSFFFELPLVLVFVVLANERRRVGLAAFGAFSLHLVSDIVGSNWPVYPFYPYSDFNITILGHVSNDTIYDVINPTVFIVGLILMAILIYVKEASPVEFFSRKLDRKLVGLYIYPLKEKCQICGSWAFIECGVCERKVCPEHIGRFSKWLCSDCRKAGK